MKNQEIFDKVATHLLKQGKRSMRKAGGCAYRGEDDTQCAVGCLITDGAYLTAMEGSGVTLMFNKWPDRMRDQGLTRRSIRLLAVLQRTHDRCLPRFWVDRLRAIAQEFHLNQKALP